MGSHQIYNSKARKIVSVLFFSTFLFFSTSCNDDEEVVPKTETIDLSVELGVPLEIWLMEGNDDFTITVNDNSLATAIYTSYTSKTGVVTVEAIKKGKTIVTILDNPTGDKLIINLEVIAHDFIIEETDIRLSMFLDREILIQSGNRQYKVSTKDPEIARAHIVETSVQEDGKSYHIIELKGIQPGSTEIYVEDVLLKKNLTIKVETTFPYMSLAVEKLEIIIETNDESQKANILSDIAQTTFLESGHIYSTVRDNGNMPLYVFEDKNSFEKGLYIKQGSFSFMVGYDIGMSFFINDEYYTVTMKAPESTYRNIFDLFEIYYLNKAVDDIPNNKIEFIEDFTYKLKDKYPTLVSAKVKSVLTLHTPYDMELPLTLIQ